MEYTILQLSKLSKVSTRTIRYYEEIKLLKPAGRYENGYRMYTEKEVDVLWQILFYRELGMKLSDIGRAMQEAEYNRAEALKGHLEELICEQERMGRLIETVRKTILMEEGKIRMTDQEKFEGLKKELIQKNEEAYGSEIRSKYGEEEIEKSNVKMMNLTDAEYEKMKKTGEELQRLLEEAAGKGMEASSAQGKQAFELHKKWLSYTWSRYTKEAHIGVVRMYLEDERFKMYYDENVEGCAEFLKEAVEIHA